MTTWYKTPAGLSRNTSIERINADSETTHRVYYRNPWGRSTWIYKLSKDYRCHQTFDEAKEYMIRRLSGQIEELENDLTKIQVMSDE